MKLAFVNGGESMDDKTFKVYCELVRAAMNSKIITYGDLAAQLGLPTRGHQLGQALRLKLDAISSYEHDHGRPLLSALVVRKNTRKPGKGFFKMAQRVGKMAASDDPSRFCEQEIKNIKKTWAN